MSNPYAPPAVVPTDAVEHLSLRPNATFVAVWTLVAMLASIVVLTPLWMGYRVGWKRHSCGTAALGAMAEGQALGGALGLCLGPGLASARARRRSDRRHREVQQRPTTSLDQPARGAHG